MNATLTALMNLFTALRTWSGWSIVLGILAVLAGKYQWVGDAINGLTTLLGVALTALGTIGHGAAVNNAGPLPPDDVAGKINGPLQGLLIGLLAFGMLAAVPACTLFAPPALTPTQQLQQQAADLETVYILAATALQAERSKISDSDWKNIWQPAEQVAYAYLLAVKTAADSGNQVDFITQRKLFNDALARIAGVPVPGAATQPQ